LLHNENSQASFSGLKEYLDENSNVARYQTYYIYDMKQRYTELGVTLPGDAAFLKDKVLNCITLSEYNEAIKMQGMEPLSLSDDSYLLLTNYSLMTDLAEAVYAARSSIFIDGQYLLPAGTIIGSVRNGLEGILIIVPDKYAKKLPYSTAVLNVNCKDSVTANHFLEQLTEFDTSVAYAQKNYTEFSSRSMIYAEASTQKAVLAYIAIYLGIIFMMTCAAILAIQQLADTADNKYRYDLLKKLGTEKKLLNKALFVQIGCYFLFPLVLAVLHSIFGLWAANDALKIYGDLHIGAGITATAIFVGILYSIYFLLTYIGSKNVINRNN
jgi:putative ABC transport system permease protein